VQRSRNPLSPYEVRWICIYIAPLESAICMWTYSTKKDLFRLKSERGGLRGCCSCIWHGLRIFANPGSPSMQRL